jgi:hypothetical protein
LVSALWQQFLEHTVSYLFLDLLVQMKNAGLQTDDALEKLDYLFHNLMKNTVNFTAVTPRRQIQRTSNQNSSVSNETG